MSATKRTESYDMINCFTYIDPATVMTIQDGARESSHNNVWSLRTEKQKLEARRNELSVKRDEVCAGLQEQYRLRCPASSASKPIT